MKKFIITFVFVGTFFCFATPVENAVFNNKSIRDAKVKELRKKAEIEKIEAVEWAKAHNLKVRQNIDGRIVELMKIDSDGRPVYYTTFNHEAAISTAANLVRETFPYNVDGESLTVGVWDGGVAQPTHPEFTSFSRVTVKDDGEIGDHPTHVAGTIGAAGVSANAKGMAPKIKIDAYDWDYDTSEMASRGASSPNSSSEIHLSNHSYGRYLGWSDFGVWYWFYDLSVLEDPNFGLYDYDAATLDSIAYNAPYYLICRAAGNDRNDGPGNGAKIYWYNSSDGEFYEATYNSDNHPKKDGLYKDGYDTIGPSGCAKNILTVGAVNEAVSGNDRNLANGTMSTFSGWGPTDDGRIKPDVVGNGVDVYSPISDSSYATWNGTSMASPNVCGSAALLVELYKNYNYENAMRSSSLKGLLIHTADDLGNTGPDFSYGWGLINTKAAADIILDDAITNIKSRVLEDFFKSENQKEYFVNLTNVQTFKATLCWTDIAGDSSSFHDDRTAKLVNDLDLRIIDFDGNTYFPFVLDVENPAEIATTGDNSVDNVEQVIIENAEIGIYKIIVSYKGNVNNQYYSLITHEMDFVLPNPPFNVFPTNGMDEVPVTSILQSSDFSDPDIPDFLSESKWQISPDNTFTSIEWEDNSYSKTVNVPVGNLKKVTQYFWRVKHKDNHGIWSEWSTATWFKTANASPPNQPVNVSPEAETESISISPTLIASGFSDGDIPDSLSTSKWQITFDNNFTSSVWEGVSSSTRIDVPFGKLASSTQYFWRVKYIDSYGLESSWSSSTWFKTVGIIDSPKITKAINKKKVLLLKGTGWFFSNPLDDEQIRIDFDGVNLLNIKEKWQNKKSISKLKANDNDNNMTGIAKIKIGGKKEGDFIIKAKRTSEKIEPVTGLYSVFLTIGNDFFTNNLNFIKGKYKE